MRRAAQNFVLAVLLVVVCVLMARLMCVWRMMVQGFQSRSALAFLRRLRVWTIAVPVHRVAMV